MATEAPGTHAAPAARGGASKVGPVAGILFVVLFAVSFLMLNTEDGDAPDQTWIDFWKDSDHRTQGWISSLTMLVAAMFFLWFAGSLRRRLAGRLGSDASHACAIAYGALLFFVGFAAGIIPVGHDLGDVVLPTNPDVIRLVDSMYYGTIFLVLPYAIAGFLIPLFWATRGTNVLPGWLGILGLVVGIIALSGPFLFVIPHMLFLIWVLIAGIMLLVRGDSAGVAG